MKLRRNRCVERAIRHFLLVLALVPAVLSSQSQASVYYFSTDITGAQTQIDVNHTSLWVTTPGGRVDILGGIFTMKAGSNASASITFSLYSGNLNLTQIATATALVSKTLTYSQFASQTANPGQFEFHAFDVATPSSPYTLLGGQTYTAVLSSAANDVQSQAYFIKDSGLMYLRDPNNLGGSAIDPALVPEPSVISMVMLGIGGLAAWSRVRRKADSV